MQSQTEKGLPSAEEAYNFFTLNFEPDPPEQAETIGRRRQKHKNEAEDEEEPEAEEEDDAVDDNQDENPDQVKLLCLSCQNGLQI